MSADNKIEYYKNKSFLSTEGLKALAYRTGINLMIFISIFVENKVKVIRCYTRFLRMTKRPGSNPVDVNRVS